MIKRSSNRKAYIYPIKDRLPTAVYNPYLDNFVESTRTHIDYLNRECPSKIGILNLFRFLPAIEMLFLNWIEDLPHKEGGVLQTVLFLMLLRMKRLLGLKVIWTLHNRISHLPGKGAMKRRIFLSLLKRSDLIITHAKEGIRLAESIVPGASSRVLYFPHPVVSRNHPSSTTKKYDILIWGTVAPYKGVDAFLEFLEREDMLSTYRILIAGKIQPQGFYEKLKRFESEQIAVRNQFIDDQELLELIGQSACVLFAYAEDTVLSSGALADSVSYGARVIGPNTGAFSDLGTLGIIQTYESFEELPAMIAGAGMSAPAPDDRARAAFVRAHSWNEFSKLLKDRIDLLFSPG